MTGTILSEDVIAKAIAAAGTDDFGAPGWREGLERSLDAFARIPLKPKVYAASVDKLVFDLATRLRIEQWFKDHPECADSQIEGPLFVIGLPRTGTTATVGMMALDEHFRFMRPWEGSAPLPATMTSRTSICTIQMAPRKTSPSSLGSTCTAIMAPIRCPATTSTGG